MGIYEKFCGKTKNFFTAFSDVYFKLNNYERLVGQNTQQTNEISELRGQINGLEDSVDTLTEQREVIAHQLSDYQEQSGENNAKVGELGKQVENLEDICKRRHKTIARLRIKIREYDKEKIRQIENSYEQRAKGSDKGHSYIIIGGHSKITTSTSDFRKDFNYNNPDKPIKGLHYFKVLKMPEDSPDYINPKQIKELLKDPEEIKLTTTIMDGKGEEKIIRFVKHVPESFEVGGHDYFYTRVDIHEIGIVKRTVGKVLRKLHVINGNPETISDFLKQHAISEVHSEAEKQKQNILS